MRKWENLPDFMKCEEVKKYYDILEKRKISLFLKRTFDIFGAIFLLILLFIPMLIIALFIKIDSKGPIFYRQDRITTYGKKFKIHKFRTMVVNADKIGSAVTIENDKRITTIGNKIRKYRIDEFPQLIDILEGNMSFVGTRPESVKYVEQYSNEMKATLLMPAGITSEASIKFKDEAKILEKYSKEIETKELMHTGVKITMKEKTVDDIYVEKILPEKMKYNLDNLKKFNCFNDLKVMIKTIIIVV